MCAASFLLFQITKEGLGSRSSSCLCSGLGSGTSTVILPEGIEFSIPAAHCRNGKLTILEEWGISKSSGVSIEQESAIVRIPLDRAEQDGDQALARVSQVLNRDFLLESA